MAGKLSAQTQLKINEVNDFLNRVHRVHGLVEQYATSKTNPEQYAQPLRRAFQQLKLHFMGAGFDALSQLCGSMEIAAGRGSSQVAKSRIMREAVGSLKFQLELEQRSLVAADIAEQEKAKKSAE